MVEKESWSPRTDHDHSTLLKRINKLLIEIGHKENIDKKIYEKTRIIAHNLGYHFGMNRNQIQESEKDTDSKFNDES